MNKTMKGAVCTVLAAFMLLESAAAAGKITDWEGKKQKQGIPEWVQKLQQEHTFFASAEGESAEDAVRLAKALAYSKGFRFGYTADEGVDDSGHKIWIYSVDALRGSTAVETRKENSVAAKEKAGDDWKISKTESISRTSITPFGILREVEYKNWNSDEWGAAVAAKAADADESLFDCEFFDLFRKNAEISAFWLQKKDGKRVFYEAYAMISVSSTVYDAMLKSWGIEDGSWNGGTLSERTRAAQKRIAEKLAAELK